ncbi:hypothetical protein A2U01_0042407, partial [Trifolium medium]|nr:hypothetical protein [Trifolium medium]
MKPLRKTTITVLTDEEDEPEVPLHKKKSTSGMGTHATKEVIQASGSYVEENKDRKRKDKMKEKSQNTKVDSGDKSESKKKKKHKKKKSKSFEDKTASTPSIQPSVETDLKEKEDMQLDTILQEPRQEILGKPID